VDSEARHWQIVAAGAVDLHPPEERRAWDLGLVLVGGSLHMRAVAGIDHTAYCPRKAV
jgi:hypothetical protein